jgi:acyl-CoA hydrolase
MPPRRLEPDDVAASLPQSGRVLVGACSGESFLLADAVMRAGEALGAMTFTGIFIPGVNTRTYLANAQCRMETFFLTPEQKISGTSVKFFPLCYGDILTRLRSVPIDAALFMATPPDAEGLCNFGPNTDFLASIWPRIPLRFAHINPRLPRVASPTAIPFDALTAYCEGEQELLGFGDGADDALSAVIGDHVAGFVSDGSTIQTGLGKISTAALRSLRGRRNLRLHSGLVPEAACDLIESGALAPGVSIVGGVAIGSRRLYDYVGDNIFRFEPVSYTHSPGVLGAIPNLVSINSALEVDLFGQAYSELGPAGLMSGPGGATDVARGVWVAGGLRILALAASAARGRISRIIAPGATAGPVSLGRMDTDVIVTEYGAADLRGLDHHERARALIAVAPPDHRDRLAEGWATTASKF